VKSILSAPGIFIEIGQSTLSVLDDDDGLELSLERLESGRLSTQCIERLKESLGVFFKKHSWSRSRGIRAYCAINARGVSLRRLSLPPCGKEELERLVALQIERELPVPAAELAWGYTLLHSGEKHEVLVAAIKRDVLDEYANLLRSCGLDPVFTLSALARCALCAESSGSYALLDIGQRQSELIWIEHGAPGGMRVVPWGGENLTRVIEAASGLDRIEAEKIKLHFDETIAGNGEMSSAVRPAVQREVSTLAKALPANYVGQKLYLTGPTTRLPLLATQLAEDAQVPCERLDLAGPEARSAAILGLRKSIQQNGAAPPPLLFQIRDEGPGVKTRAPATWKWAALAVMLAIVSVALRYADVVTNQPRLARKLASMKAFRENLPNIERELAFLQYLKTNQPVYIDAISVIANSIGGGTRLDTLSISRSGDISLRATMRDAQQVMDFRSKLLDSGFFSSVVVEEQTPSASDKQKLTVRMSGQWKLGSELPATAPAPAEKPKPAVRKEQG
jgi:Tfp pilus assembly PilM family ATPase